MIDIIRLEEAPPSAYPDAPSGLSEGAEALEAEMIWSRIEAYTAHRFTDREVVWTIEGREDDDWTPSLAPVTSVTAEKWESGAWVSTTLPDGPLGYCVPSDGIFRVRAQVGAGPTPAAITEAFRRLAEYSAEIGDRGLLKDAPGATSYSSNLGGEIQESFSRHAAWAARAIQNSGAGDLLRPYRRT